MDAQYLIELARSVAQIKRMLMDIKEHLGLTECDCKKNERDSFGYCIHGNRE